ncbi:diguanylate cyclase [Kangiella marina]|uniref:sensor domain-containing diguanylate cyclase n=1 Tax=Kangiella marina TaxID=1079178 RepID=UPI0031F0A9A2
MLGFSTPGLYAKDDIPPPQAIDLAVIQQGQSTGTDFYYFYDSSREVTLEEALQSDRWQAPESKRNNRGFTEHVIWMKLQFKNSEDEAKRFILEYIDPAIKTLDVYYKSSSELEYNHQNFTYSNPSATRPVSFYRPAFALEAPASDTVDVYLRMFPGDDFPMHSFTEMLIWHEKPFYKSTHVELILMSILLCVEIFMGIATLLIYFSSKDKVFLYYSVFAFSAASLFAAFGGLWPYLIATESYELRMVVLQISLCQMAAIVFVQYFLKTKEHMPLVHKMMTAVVGICLVGLILNLAGYPYLSRIIIDYTAIGYFALIPIGLYSHKKGVPHSLLFTSSWIVFIMGMVLASARLRGYIVDSSVAKWLIFYGGFIEIFLLSTIMYLRFRDLQKEKVDVERRYRRHLEKAAEELKRQVDEKTKQLKLAKQQAEQDARIDILTQLTNRRAFIEIANQHIELAAQNIDKSLYLAIIDVDHFKKVNDTYGHNVGDFVLKAVSDTLLENVRNVDLVSRLGGEEFSVIVEAENEQTALQMVERLRAAVEAKTVKVQGHTINVTISIGMASWYANQSLDSLMSAADEALYTAKRKGRNQTHF